jgi:hypothetical protein
MIASLSNEGRTYEIPSDSCCSFKPLPVPKGKVSINANPYKPQLGRSLLEMQLSGSLYRSKPFFSKDEIDTTNLSELQLGAALSSSRSDALQKKSLTIGAALGIVRSTSIEDSSNDNNLQSIADLINGSVKLNHSVKKGLKLNDKFAKKSICNQKLLTPGFQAMIAKEASGSDTSSGNKKSQSVMPFLQPFFSLANNSHEISYEAQITATMAMMFLPVAVNAYTFTDWDLTRNLSAGLAFNAEIYPLSGLIFHCQLCGVILNTTTRIWHITTMIIARYLSMVVHNLFLKHKLLTL